MITSMRHRKKASVLMLQSLPGPQVIYVALFKFLGRGRQAPSACGPVGWSLMCVVCSVSLFFVC